MAVIALCNDFLRFLTGGGLSAALAVAIAHTLRSGTFVLHDNQHMQRSKRRKMTYQLAIEPACVAVQLVIEAATPQRCIGSTAI